MPSDDVGDAAETGSTDPVKDLFQSTVPEDDDEGSSDDVPETRPVVQQSTNRMTTDIESIDRLMGGGIPLGRILCFIAPPDTQSELLVKQLAAAHNCLYLSTLRPKWEVQEEVTDHVQQSGSQRAGRTTVRIEQLNPDAWLDDARRYIESIDENTIVVIDSVNELEELEKPRYVRFINDVKRRLWDTGSVGLFYGIEDDPPPAQRAVTLRRADLVWQLRRSVQPGEVQHLLVISKFRGGRSLTEPVKLELTDEVSVDTSRDIA